MLRMEQGKRGHRQHGRRADGPGGRDVGPVMDSEDEEEQIKQSLSKPSSSILSHHNPEPSPANLTVAPRVSLALLSPKGEVRKRGFSVQFVSVGQKGSSPKGFDTSLVFIT